MFLVQSSFCITNCHKENFRREGSYIDSPERMKKKKAIINPKNKDNKCIQFAVTVELWKKLLISKKIFKHQTVYNQIHVKRNKLSIKNR